MVDEGSKRNGCDKVVLGSKRETRNDSVPRVDYSGSCSLQTYKRQKRSKTSYTSSSETKYIETKTSANSVNPLSDKIRKELVNSGFHNSSCNEDESIVRTNSHDYVNGCGKLSPDHWRKIALQQMCQSLSGNEDGLKGCIRDALEIQTQSLFTSSVRESDPIAEGVNRCTSNPHNISKPHDLIVSNGSANESNEQSNTELCRHALFNILTSDKFRDLCHLILDNFNGVRVDSLFDVRAIDARMKVGAYENSPHSFHIDLQLVWKKLELIGTKMITFSKDISEKSRSNYEQVGYSRPRIPDNGNKELSIQEQNTDLKMEQAEAGVPYKLCTCRHCEQKAIWKDCLVCDSCEEMYHISCTKIPKHQIPPATWYCTLCINSGTISLHDNCTLCEKLYPLKTKTLTEITTQTPSKQEDTQNLTDISKQCYRCRCDVKDEDDFRICTHDDCPHSHYHIRCLSRKQLNSYTPRWFCPSCLCRACLTDRDDAKILLCDSCDDSYHIYCLDPPLHEIPEGKWFCRKCDAGVKRIREARMAYENKLEKVESVVNISNPFEIKMKPRRRGRPSKKKTGVDMLLNAAKTLDESVVAEKMEGGVVNL